MVRMVEYSSSDWIRGHTPGLFRSFQLGWISAKDSRDNPAKLGRSICCSMSAQARAQRYFLPLLGGFPISSVCRDFLHPWKHHPISRLAPPNPGLCCLQVARLWWTNRRPGISFESWHHHRNRTDQSQPPCPGKACSRSWRATVVEQQKSQSTRCTGGSGYSASPVPKAQVLPSIIGAAMRSRFEVPLAEATVVKQKLHRTESDAINGRTDQWG